MAHSLPHPAPKASTAARVVVWAHDLSSRSFDLMVADFARQAGALDSLEEVGSVEAARISLLRGCRQGGLRVALVCLDLPRAEETVALALELGYAVVLLGFGRRYLPPALREAPLSELHPHATSQQIRAVLASLRSRPVDLEAAFREAMPLSERERPSWIG